MPPSISFTRLGLSNLRSSLQRLTTTATPARQARSFASVLPSVPATPASKSKLPGNVVDARKPGALRPHLGVEVDPNHGLYAFFRKQVENGVTKYETVEPLDFGKTAPGRAWTAAELRRKSFKDLHTLWYVLLRERNLLATQNEEGRRMGTMQTRLGSGDKVYRVRKSMARIKYVLNERRLAYEGAVEIFENKGKVKMLQRQARREKHKAGLTKAAEAEAQKKKDAGKAEPLNEATKLAVSGLLETAPAS